VRQTPKDLGKLPYLLYADEKGRIFEHPYLRMAGSWGSDPAPMEDKDLVPLPELSKLFYLPGCAPVGLDPETGLYEVVDKSELGEDLGECHAVAAFCEPGIVRTHLPAADMSAKDYVLPSWAYTAVGFRDDRYWAAGFRVEDNPRWDPQNYDDRELVPAIENYRRAHPPGRLVDHLENCATCNHCFAAKNLFLGRWEAPLPVSRSCNAACLGCLSLQPAEGCAASHDRISFTPTVDEIVELAVSHLEGSPAAIVSYGQGCEGEPLTEHALLSESVREIRRRTPRGTINLNTNGSLPARVAEIARSGLDSIRISLNSARPEVYAAYYRPRGYDFGDVVESLKLSKDFGLYTMINYLVFPGVSDREAEVEALRRLLETTGVDFLHLKNLCIDPKLYLESMPRETSRALGIRRAAEDLARTFPGLEIGYFNKPVRD